jgi:tungstate transport system ATP-binding protein
MAFLETRELGKAYGRAQILKDITLCAKKGEVLALIGPTGSGKTTLLRLINLLDEPSDGCVILDGVDVTALPEKEKLQARRRMSMVFQKPVMFKGSVRENVSFGLKVRGKGNPKKVDESLRAVGLDSFGSRDASTLSGGEMQRTALARALVLEPELLLLDEPTANLDPKSAASIDRLIRSLSRETTVIMATHNMLQCHRLADRVAVIQGGRLTVIGRPEEVFASLMKQDEFSLSSPATW